MKIDDGIETLTKFFNDLIGTLIPGAVFVIGLGVMHLGPVKLLSLAKSIDNGIVASVFLALLFAVGHGLLAFHSVILEQLLSGVKVTKLFDIKSAELRQSYVAFKKIANEKAKTMNVIAEVSDPAWGYKDLRSLALSVSAEASSLGRRFMFIALLCNGVGASLVLIFLDFLGCSLLSPKALFLYPNALPLWGQSLLLMFAAFVFFKRAEVFYSRAMTTPFAVAVAELTFKRAEHESK